MSESAVASKPSSSAGSKTKLERAHCYLGVVSTTLGILGVVGTMFVWLTANLYVGDLEVRPDRPEKALTVKVYDRKGQEAVFHTNRFQLMPGSYQLEVVESGGTTHRADAEVRFRELSVVPVVLSEVGDLESQTEPDKPAKRRWWQFWRG